MTSFEKCNSNIVQCDLDDIMIIDLTKYIGASKHILLGPLYCLFQGVLQANFSYI